MEIAFLFNADHPELGGWYGASVMHRVLATNVIQASSRSMRVSVGDILTYGAISHSQTPTVANLKSLCRKVYRPNDLDLLIANRLNATFGRATVFCWLFQNMTSEIGHELHAQLANDPVYLGAMDVNFSNRYHLQFFRNSLVECYRFRGKSCSIFYSMGENDDPDVAIRSIFEEHGFRVIYEDSGARRTIFDNYDGIDHSTRVQDFKRVFAKLNGISSDEISNLALSLEELHPKLFDVLASIARTLERSETAEDLAQVALSGRRFLEMTADCLFPPRDTKWRERDVGKMQHKNRLWAYIDETTSAVGIDDATVLQTLGGEVDRLFALFNAGLHANREKKEMEAAFRDLLSWLTHVIEISPSHARRPYLAYEQELDKFMREVTKAGAGKSDSSE